MSNDISGPAMLPQLGSHMLDVCRRQLRISFETDEKVIFVPTAAAKLASRTASAKTLVGRPIFTSLLT